MQENYHTHTYRCRHAVGSEEEYIRNAIDGGLKVLGFSDHTPFLFPGNYYSHMRMYPDELANYAATVLSLKEKYADQIEIHLGLEVEYYPDRMEALLDMIAPFHIEYMILGQHWCGNEQNEPYNGAATANPAHLAQYCYQVTEAMDTGLFSYLAHPDLLYFTGDANCYRKQVTGLCQAAKQRDIPLELNLLGIREHRHYPRQLFWEIAGEVGCQVVLGSDAHRPEDVVTPQAETIALEMVRKYNLQLLDRVPIRPWQDGKRIF